MATWRVPTEPPAPPVVFDHQRLAEHLAHGLGDSARQHIIAAAGGIRNDQRDRMIRITGLRLRRDRPSCHPTQ
ncbi:MAG: hypothetical protein WA763_23800 [Pseudolabrys sp.]